MRRNNSVVKFWNLCSITLAIGFIPLAALGADHECSVREILNGSVGCTPPVHKTKAKKSKKRKKAKVVAAAQPVAEVPKAVEQVALTSAPAPVPPTEVKAPEPAAPAPVAVIDYANQLRMDEAKKLFPSFVAEINGGKFQLRAKITQECKDKFDNLKLGFEPRSEAGAIYITVNDENGVLRECVKSASACSTNHNCKYADLSRDLTLDNIDDRAHETVAVKLGFVDPNKVRSSKARVDESWDFEPALSYQSQATSARIEREKRSSESQKAREERETRVRIHAALAINNVSSCRGSEDKLDRAKRGLEYLQRQDVDAIESLGLKVPDLEKAQREIDIDELKLIKKSILEKNKSMDDVDSLLAKAMDMANEHSSLSERVAEICVAAAQRHTNVKDASREDWKSARDIISGCKDLPNLSDKTLATFDKYLTVDLPTNEVAALASNGINNNFALQFGLNNLSQQLNMNAQQTCQTTGLYSESCVNAIQTAKLAPAGIYAKATQVEQQRQQLNNALAAQFGQQNPMASAGGFNGGGANTGPQWAGGAFGNFSFSRQ